MKPTWIIEFIPCGTPSFHTHGLNRYGCLELELNLPLNPKQAMLFINLLGEQIAWHGKRYRSGSREDDVFNLPCYLFETTPIQASKENDQVLRVLFCDPEGKYPWEPGCQWPYSNQLNAAEKAEMARLLEGGGTP